MTNHDNSFLIPVCRPPLKICQDQGAQIGAKVFELVLVQIVGTIVIKPGKLKTPLGTKGNYRATSETVHMRIARIWYRSNIADPRYQVEKAEHSITLWLFHIAMEIYLQYLPIQKCVFLSYFNLATDPPTTHGDGPSH